MVTFDRREPGTTESEWQDYAPLNSAPLLDLDHVSTLIVVAAHPDDETLGASGLIARVAGLGGRVTLIVASDGERSHPDSPTHSPTSIAARRRGELLNAMDAVAGDIEIAFLGLPDGALIDQLPAITAAVHGAAHRARTGRTLIASTFLGDGHGDHRAVALAARAVAADENTTVLEYPIWLWHWAAPGDPAVVPEALKRLDLTSDECLAKARAIAAHVSQTSGLSLLDGDEPIIDDAMRAHFTRPFEIFVETSFAATAGSAGTLPAEFFETFYEGKPDPWGFETRWYEARKRAITLASLPEERYGRALEVGCSTGVLTAELAPRCGSLRAIDISTTAVARARQRLRGVASVVVDVMDVSRDWPAGLFDLIVISEVAYYLSRADLETMIDRSIAALTTDGTLVACHWLHPVDEYPLSGAEVQAAFRAREELIVLASHHEDDFDLAVYGRPTAQSVARRAGLA